jgi:hypothetical protein
VLKTFFGNVANTTFVKRRQETSFGVSQIWNGTWKTHLKCRRTCFWTTHLIGNYSTFFYVCTFVCMYTNCDKFKCPQRMRNKRCTCLQKYYYETDAEKSRSRQIPERSSQQSFLCPKWSRFGSSSTARFLVELTSEVNVTVVKLKLLRLVSL